MRPLRLELKGFSAFREPAAIDFEALDVFAISGPTGSGKSSLLDAMTYALYGRVERVGDRVSQLVSQGQPRMAVTLEFAVGNDRYRVTRSTPSGKGTTKILLERQDEAGEWKQAGEGADRVREAGPLIARAIGLTYDGFTRSVLLPQGRFAEFLVGDAAKRREILTELLGLALFRRMAERAGAIARESSIRAQERELTLEREYAEATPEALKEARKLAGEAEKREKTLTDAADQVAGILGRWREAERSAEELRACAAEAEAAAGRARAAAEAVAVLVEELEDAASLVEQCGAASRAAREALEGTRSALRHADGTLRPADELARARLWAHSLAEALRAREGKRVELERATGAAEELADHVKLSEGAVAESQSRLAALETEVRNAEGELEEARHADLVAAVSAGLKAGDSCPVCGLPLAKAPKRSGTRALEAATTSLERAREERDAATGAVGKAERSAEAARRGAAANATDRARLASEIEGLDRAAAEEVSRLQAVLGDPLPLDAAEEIARRSAERERLDRAEREAAREAAEAAQALSAAERERDRVVASIDRQRDRLATDHRPLFERAARAVGRELVSTNPPALPGDLGLALLAFAAAISGVLAAFAERVAEEASLRSSLEGRLVQEATEKVGGLVEPAPTLAALAEAVAVACAEATRVATVAARRAEELAEKLVSKKRLTEEVKELTARAGMFKTLALELRADRLIAFLQAEALQLLAAAGSDRLQSLSDGRYRLLCRDDEFLVVDTWNGDEERSVRTLSGGETFLASLGLSLALADQVRSLSVTARARLDSLFLDEGFGTLDSESLRTVTEAIEQLAGDGRLVGVITHVPELAEQFPQIVVQKRPTGSRLALVP